MRIAILLICIGIIITSLGIIFHYQGYGIIGPESSFMYKNSQWIENGQKIIIFGTVILSIGIFLKVRTMLRLKS